MFQTNFVEKIKHTLMFNTFLFENRDVYEKMWKHMGQPGTPQTAIQYGVCFACWINKATNTLRIYNTYCYSLAIMVERTRIDFPFIRTLPVMFISVTKVGVTPKYFKYIANMQINRPMKELFYSSTNSVGQPYYCCHSDTPIYSSLTEKKIMTLLQLILGSFQVLIHCTFMN
jgi:hypothetical protein